MSEQLNEEAYLLICSDFRAVGGEYEINYGACQLKAPLASGMYRDQLTMTDTVESLLVAVLPLKAPEDAIYFEWQAENEGSTLTIR
ncbi:MAG: hypothetical protein ACI87W_000901 [Halieaceae bacterium]|jgi:hypothetical protein